MVRGWDGVSRESMAAPSLEVTKARLKQPGIVEGVPAHGRVLEEGDPQRFLPTGKNSTIFHDNHHN